MLPVINFQDYKRVIALISQAIMATEIVRHDHIMGQLQEMAEGIRHIQNIHEMWPAFPKWNESEKWNSVLLHSQI